jgi:hypothetical protein
MESRSPCHLGWAWLSQTSYQKDDRRPARYDNLTRTSREGVDAMLDRLGRGGQTPSKDHSTTEDATSAVA